MLWFEIHRSSEKTLTEQVYEKISQKILDNSLKENEKIPSSRELASSLGISRNVILEAYHQLEAEGYIQIRPRSGTFVSTGTSISQIKSEAHSDPNYHITFPKGDKTIDFKAGNPAMDQFPRPIWGKIAKEVCLDSPNSLFGYLPKKGICDLQHALATYLKKMRGVTCHPRQIVITSGATQALSFITKLLKDHGDFVAVEDPVTDEMRNIFTTGGACVMPIPTDEFGIIPSKLPVKEQPHFLFVIPSHQFPLGGTLPIQRRIELITYARKHNCYIVEDDYDSEFTYEGVPVRSMQGLAPEKVIYVGTFSKILSPALRIGYAVLPEELVEPFQHIKWYSDRHNSSLEQLVLARFITEGHLQKHIRKMKRIYQKRRETLVQELNKHFPHVTIIGQKAGMHLVVDFKHVEFTSKLMQKVYDNGVTVYPVEQYALEKGRHRSKIVMGYGSLSEEEIKKGVAWLKEVLN
ncbi:MULTISPECIES: MocR-like pyridoxine biosynthesis transcription factor PdxR [Bacillus]|uniref:MocR-like pyridoxine biosynthesis transcription factor PdxR n=1 Tax=Bacillus TaxID=1386 RepID=UPI000BB77DEC|nr:MULTISPECIES: PLP-dependent aminotransferase family protein [Bacillus]